MSWSPVAAGSATLLESSSSGCQKKVVILIEEQRPRGQVLREFRTKRGKSPSCSYGRSPTRFPVLNQVRRFSRICGGSKRRLVRSRGACTMRMSSMGVLVNLGMVPVMSSILR
ncbi:hypothetical protein BV25DRAFT_1283768 [Artomyces pyxidatus]|uniref:Uncharacterized protein n=1 Tax=Artomyces pyxidatus TaxID=48021 RepID=A0ACB8SPH9_9AGAM|nr:hypothetical protein BV25DRAFT_1283768 [Artomyces pyxidatus]